MTRLIATSASTGVVVEGASVDGRLQLDRKAEGSSGAHEDVELHAVALGHLRDRGAALLAQHQFERQQREPPGAVGAPDLILSRSRRQQLLQERLARTTRIPLEPLQELLPACHLPLIVLAGHSPSRSAPILPGLCRYAPIPPSHAGRGERFAFAARSSTAIRVAGPRLRPATVESRPAVREHQRSR
jgi:hypothetical protein